MEKKETTTLGDRIYHNYTALMMLVMSFFFLDFNLLLTTLAGYVFYKNRNYLNGVSLLFTTSVYLFGLFNSMFYGLCVLLFKIMTNFDGFMKMVTAGYHDMCSMVEMYEKSENKNDHLMNTFLGARDLKNRIIENFLLKLKDLKEKIGFDHYYNLISDFEKTYDLMHKVGMVNSYINTNLSFVFQMLYSLVQKNQLAQNIMNEVSGQLDKTYRIVNYEGEQKIENKELQVKNETEMQTLMKTVMGQEFDKNMPVPTKEDMEKLAAGLGELTKISNQLEKMAPKKMKKRR